jgi:glycosyltransferase involved in cell wall biosynthesis
MMVSRFADGDFRIAGRQVMKIACVSSFDPLSTSSWSGCSYYLARALTANRSLSLDFIGPLQEKTSPLLQTKGPFYRRLFGRNYLPNVDPVVLKDYARQTAKALQNSDADFILSLGALPIAYLETKKPIIYFWDCTFQGNLEYPWFRNLAPESIRYGHEMERLALEKCKIAAYSSNWAVQTAIEKYGVAKAKLKVIPLGANLNCQRTLNDVAQLVDARSKQTCKLLFIGIDWIRKGGDVAYEVAKQLNARGLETLLTIIGCAPQISEPLPSFVRSLGFLNKFENENEKEINNLLARSHFLIVPSIAESFGAVFCEASSFGTPSLARRIGGIPTAVRDGVNGQLFSRDATASEYCDFILDRFRDYARYRALALSSFNEYKTRLNWAKTAEGIVQLFEGLSVQN